MATWLKCEAGRPCVPRTSSSGIAHPFEPGPCPPSPLPSRSRSQTAPSTRIPARSRASMSRRNLARTCKGRARCLPRQRSPGSHAPHHRKRRDRDRDGEERRSRRPRAHPPRRSACSRRSREGTPPRRLGHHRPRHRGRLLLRLRPRRALHAGRSRGDGGADNRVSNPDHQRRSMDVASKPLTADRSTQFSSRAWGASRRSHGSRCSQFEMRGIFGAVVGDGEFLDGVAPERRP